ncbi:MAG TPA: hypothetical protein VEC06_06260 [Paucimonas sp.]|nr:hypothetical protein [Paucimonas sp.]
MVKIDGRYAIGLGGILFEDFGVGRYDLLERLRPRVTSAAPSGSSV